MTIGETIRRIRQWAGAKISGRYEGATFSPQRSVIPAAYQSARYDADSHSRQELARKMRYFERNNPLVQALAGKFENFVVGANSLVIPNSSDPEYNKRARDWFYEWTDVCDLTTRENFSSRMCLGARRWFIEGDVFVVLTSGATDRGSRPRIQMVESHQCRTPKEYEKDERVHDGVRMDEYGRPTYYYFGEEIARGSYRFDNPRPADSVIPIFEPSRPGEVRGITFFHSCINEIHDLDDLHIMEMQAARENSSVTNWIETATGEVDTDDMRRARLSNGNQNSDGTAITEDRVQYYQEITGGRAKVLKIGDKVHQNPGERPSVTTVEYWKLKRELVCVAVEIPYWMIFPEDVQGTAYRGQLDMATAFFRSRHATMASVMRRCYRYAMNWANRNEPKFRDPPYDWAKVSIIPPRAPNVDVGRNSSAMLAELAAGATNWDLVYGPLGLDAREELRKRAENARYIRDLAKEYGVEVSEISQMQQAQQTADASVDAPVKSNEAA